MNKMQNVIDGLKGILDLIPDEILEEEGKKEELKKIKTDLKNKEKKDKKTEEKEKELTK